MNAWICNYICIFILLYRYDDKITQNSLCTFIIIFILLFEFEFVYLLKNVILNGTSYANYL